MPVVVAAILFTSSTAFPAVEDGAVAIAEAYQLDGVSDAVAFIIGSEMRGELSRRVKEWIVEAFTESWFSPGSNGNDLGFRTSLSEDKKEEVKRRLKEKVKKHLPEIARRVLLKKFFQSGVGMRGREVEGLVRKTVDELKVSLNDRVDQIAEHLYSHAISQIEEQIKKDVGPMRFDAADIRGSLESSLDMGAAEWGFWKGIIELVGESTAGALKKRFDDIISGELPSEVVKYFTYGPDKFSEFASKIKENLPGEKLSELKDKVLHMPLFLMPNEVYCGILAASAARHFAAAFKGAYVDLYELKRGTEVTRVMIWQAANKEALSMDLSTLLIFAKNMAGIFELSLDKLGRFGTNMKEALAKMKELEVKVKKIDELVNGKLDGMETDLKEIVSDVEGTLKDIQDSLLSPVADGYGVVRGGVDSVRGHLMENLPENFHGIPANWAYFKDQVMIENILGRKGDVTPWWMLGEFAKKAGLVRAWEKLEGDMKDIGEKINDAVSGAISSVGAEAAEAFGLTDPLARTLGIPDVPAENPSLENPLDPVLLHNGEYYSYTVDLAVPGRGIDWVFARIYRSRANFKGVLGYNWSHNYEERLVPNGKEVIYLDEMGRRFVFVCDDVHNCQSPKGIFSILYKAEAERTHYLLREPDGMTTTFGSSGLMVEKRDRYGNRLRFDHDRFGRLIKVTDTLDREYKYSYNENGQLVSVKDFTGREVTFSCDKHSDLVSVTGPKTSDYPKGKTRNFAYSTGYIDEQLNHNLVRVMDPNGNIYLKITYGESGAGFDRVISQQYGGDGGRITVSYMDNGVADVIDKRGIRHRYKHNDEGNLISEWIYDTWGRPHMVKSYEYNKDGLIAAVSARDGIKRSFKYDEKNQSRLAHANLLEAAIIDRGGRESVVWKYLYEPNYNQIKQSEGVSGVVKVYDFDTSGNIISLTVKTKDSKEEITEKFEYNEYGQMIRRVDPEGNVFTYSYADGFLVEDAAGNKYSYDSAGNVTGVTDALGNTTQFVLNQLNQLISEISPEPFKYEKRYIYDANDNISEIVAGNARFKFAYNDLDNMIEQSAYLDGGRWIASKWGRDPDGRIVKAIDPTGREIAYKYNIFGDLTEIRRGAGSTDEQVILLSYNRFGDLAVFANGAGQAVRIETDDLGRVRKVVDAMGNAAAYRRDESGRVIGIRRVDSRSNLLAETTYIYDDFGRLLSEKRLLFSLNASGQTWVEKRYSRNRRGEVVSITDAGGDVWRYSYDRFGRIVSICDPVGNRIEYKYDAAGHLVSSTVFEAGGGEIVTGFTHDAMGRLSYFRNTYGTVISFDYDQAGSVIKMIGPRGDEKHFEYDNLGRRIAVNTRISADDFSKTSFEWDDAGRLKKATDANGNSTRYEYDSLGRLARTVYPDASEERYIYDLADNLITVKKRDGTIIYNLYDAVSNLIARRISSSPLRGEGWGGGGTTFQWFAYDGLGRMIASLDNNDPADPEDDEMQYYRYDSLSRMIGESIGGRWVVSAFDSVGRRKMIRYPSGRVLYNTHDKIGRPVSSFFDGKNVFSSDYVGILRVSGRTLGNGIRELFTTNLIDWLLGLKVVKDGATLREISYNYLPDGLLEDKTTGGATIRYSYDKMGRLIAAGGDYLWDLDKVGNWLKYSAGGEIKTFKYNNLNQPAGLEYSASGNLIKDSRHHYIYDGLMRLIEVRKADSTVITRYTYDALNRRMRITRDAKRETSCVYDGWNVIEEYNGDDLVKTYIYEDRTNRPVYIIDEGGKGFFPHTDRLGTPLYLSDGGGTIVADYDFEPYGAPMLGPVEQYPFAMAGGSYDYDTGLYWLKNRYYEPRLGRFLTTDPLGYKNAFYSGRHIVPDGSRFKSTDYIGMDARRPFIPQALFAKAMSDITLPEMNLYQYAMGNPINFSDPLGLRVFLVQDGNAISIKITIETYGQLASEEMNRFIKDSIENAWSGKFGRYSVTTTADVTLRGPSSDFERHRFNVVESHKRSYVQCLGCSRGELFLGGYTFVSPHAAAYDAVEIAHEVGHFFGVDDYYIEGMERPKPGWEGNIMACIGIECSVDERNIEEILARYNNGELNKDLSGYSKPPRLNLRKERKARKQIPDYLDYK